METELFWTENHGSQLASNEITIHEKKITNHLTFHEKNKAVHESRKFPLPPSITLGLFLKERLCAHPFPGDLVT